jgi:hypothetical protein
MDRRVKHPEYDQKLPVCRPLFYGIAKHLSLKLREDKSSVPEQGFEIGHRRELSFVKFVELCNCSQKFPL